MHTISIIVTLGGEGPESRYIRRILDSLEVSEKIKAVVVDEAHVIEEW